MLEGPAGKQKNMNCRVQQGDAWQEWCRWEGLARVEAGEAPGTLTATFQSLGKESHVLGLRKELHLRDSSVLEVGLPSVSLWSSRLTPVPSINTC